LLDRVNFLRMNKKEIKELERKDGFVDLTSDFFINSQFKSINSEIIAEVGHKKYMTLSGVGRICAVKIVFPEGIRMKIQVNSIDACLKKRLIEINNLYIYSNRFANLKKYGIDVKEILECKRINTKTCRRRGKFLARQSRKIFNKIIPLK
jgi:hypothetical protein